MIPTLLVLGAVLYRWWSWTILGAALGWPLLLWATDVVDSWREVGIAAGFAAANVACGAMIVNGVVQFVRTRRRNRGAS